MDSEIEILEGRPIVEGRAEAEALVSTVPINFLKGIDPESGVVVEGGHPLEGESVQGKVLCFPHGRGSTVGSYILYALSKGGLGPAAIVNEVADPVIVVGAIIGSIPMVDKIEISKIRTGDLVEVDGGKGLVKIRRGR